MQIRVKTIDNKLAVIEVDDSDTVKIIKDKIEKEFPGKTAATQKLIYNGKILNDNQIASEIGFSDTKYLVVMTQVSTQPAPPTQASSSITPASASTSNNTVSANFSTPAPAAAPATSPPAIVSTPSRPPASTNNRETIPVPLATPSPPEAQQRINPSTPSITPEGFDEMVNTLCSFGFPANDVKRAMQLTKNNPDAAMAILTGDLNMEDLNPSSGDHPHDAAQGMDFYNEEDEDEHEGTLQEGGYRFAADHPLGQLERDPQFLELRDAVVQNPQLLPLILQQIASQSPAVAEAILANQNDFLNLLREGGGAGPSMFQGAGDGSTGEAGGDNSEGTTTIRLTESDANAVARLMEFTSCDRDSVIQAYFACGKNEDDTANFLFSNKNFFD